MLNKKDYLYNEKMSIALELNRLERLERFELEKAKYKDNRLNIISEELANLTDDDIEKILQIIEKSKEADQDE